MPIEAENPLAAGLAAATGLLTGASQGRDAVEEKRRQDVLDRQNAAAAAAALAHQQHEEGVEDADLGLRRTADARAVTEASDRHSAALLATKTNQAQYDFDNSPAVLNARRQTAVLQAQLLRGQVSQQQFAIQSAAAEAAIAHVRQQVAQKYGLSDADLANQQGAANLDVTRAGTARTQQDTSQESQLFPYALQAASQNLYGTELDNEGKRRGLASPSANPALTIDPAKDPHAKDVENLSSQAMKTYAQQAAKFQASDAFGSAKPNDDGSYSDPDDPKKILLRKPPEDFETFSAALGTVIQQIAKDPKSLAHITKQIDADPDMLPFQKAYAKARVTEAAKAGVSSSGGGPFPGTASAEASAAGFSGTSEHLRLVSTAAREFGVPEAIAQSVYQQESTGGTNLSSPGNPGSGGFQLDPASNAPADVIAAVATDPVLSARVAMNQLRTLYEQNGESWPAAVAAYNSGSPPGPTNPKGTAYANEVLSRAATWRPEYAKPGAPPKPKPKPPTPPRPRPTPKPPTVPYATSASAEVGNVPGLAGFLSGLFGTNRPGITDTATATYEGTR